MTSGLDLGAWQLPQPEFDVELKMPFDIALPPLHGFDDIGAALSNASVWDVVNKVSGEGGDPQNSGTGWLFWSSKYFQSLRVSAIPTCKADNASLPAAFRQAARVGVREAVLGVLCPSPRMG